MIIYIFFFLKLFLLRGDRGHKNHEARNAVLGCTQSAYNLKYNLRMNN